MNLKQNADGSVGFESPLTPGGAGEFVKATYVWNPTSVSTPFYVASRAMIVQAITARVEVAGTDAGAVTAVVNKASSGTAMGAGTTMHSGNINLKGTAATNQPLTLSTTPATLKLAAGDSLSVVLTGVMTAAVGCVTIAMAPA